MSNTASDNSDTQATAAIQQQHMAFVKEAATTGKVWVLDNDEDGVAVSTSNYFDEVAVIPFWSDAASAKLSATEDWANYKVVEIDLPTFLEAHVVMMSNDEVLVGTNWGQDMLGNEIEPTELALEIIAELKAQNKSITFEEYPSLAEYETATREAWALVKASYVEDDAE